MDGYVSKPIRRQQLVEAIQSALRRPDDDSPLTQTQTVGETSISV
jgi:hypothetical protein